MSQPEETARQDDPVESAPPEDAEEEAAEDRPARQQDPAGNKDLEGAPRGDPTP
jgi:hypothetical protein